jgi:hypothetical protein
MIGRGERWQRFSKGGEYSPPYDDIHLLLDWGLAGEQLRAFPGCFIRNDSFYLKPGATYTVRTASAFAGKALPADCVFSHNAQSWFPASPTLALLSIGYLSTRVPQTFIELAVGSGDIATAGSAARRYTTAVIEGVPCAPLSVLDTERNLAAVRALFGFRVREFLADETSCHFCSFRSSLDATSLRAAVSCWNHAFLEDVVNALRESAVLDEAVSRAFGLGEEESRFVDTEVGLHPTSYTGSAVAGELMRLYHLPEEELMAEAVGHWGAKRWFTKKSYFVDRRVEIVCHYLQVPPQLILDSLLGHTVALELAPRCQSVLSEPLGCAFGRWDIRYATGERQPPGLPAPFAPLPVCPPGTLQNSDGLPARPDDVPAGYPIDIPWDGILVDDPGHPRDIEARVRRVLEVIWQVRAGAIEQEACEILGVRSLRDYFAKPARFFADHLQRYSKSRRKAPIYWPLSTPSGSYTLWIYYHRLTDQTLYTCVNNFVEPKLQQIADSAVQLRQKADRIIRDEKDLERLTDLELELREFRDELLRLAPIWKPNLNDGVQITAAPLWRLFQHRPWKKILKETWQQLEKGDYDWAHLAYSLWPDRVRDKCRTDKSLAIAHDLEALYVEPPPSAKKKRGRRPAETGSDEAQDADDTV